MITDFVNPPTTINYKGTEIETCFIQVNYEHESTPQLHNS